MQPRQGSTRLHAILASVLLAALLTVDFADAETMLRKLGEVRGDHSSISAEIQSDRHGKSILLTIERSSSDVSSTILLTRSDQLSWLRTAIEYYYRKRGHRGEMIASDPMVSGNSSTTVAVFDDGAAVLVITEGRLDRFFTITPDNYHELLRLLSRCANELR